MVPYADGTVTPSRFRLGSNGGGKGKGTEAAASPLPPSGAAHGSELF